MKFKELSLTAYLDSLLTKGRYTFTQTEALSILKVSPNAFRLAALRLTKKKRLIRPAKGFYVIVPIEYQNIGTLPVAWFIDDLMENYQQRYYVGLLSAAALYGAAHQQPQVFQVMTNKPLRKIQKGRLNIQFFTKKDIGIDSHQTMKVPTGYMNVSIPEMTALDLMQYSKSVGYLSHVATVLSELQENLDMKRFANILTQEAIEAPHVQRLGYLLEQVEAKEEIIVLLKEWVTKHKPRSVPLRPDKGYEKYQENTDWHLYINEDIEIDI